MYLPSVLMGYLEAGEDKEADERARGPPTCSLRVCGQWLLGVAQICKSHISKVFSVPCIAYYCRALHPG